MDFEVIVKYNGDILRLENELGVIVGNLISYVCNNIIKRKGKF